MEARGREVEIIHVRHAAILLQHTATMEAQSREEELIHMKVTATHCNNGSIE